MKKIYAEMKLKIMDAILSDATFEVEDNATKKEIELKAVGLMLENFEWGYSEVK